MTLEDFVHALDELFAIFDYFLFFEQGHVALGLWILYCSFIGFHGLLVVVRFSIVLIFQSLVCILDFLLIY